MDVDHPKNVVYKIQNDHEWLRPCGLEAGVAQAMPLRSHKRLRVGSGSYALQWRRLRLRYPLQSVATLCSGEAYACAQARGRRSAGYASA